VQQIVTQPRAAPYGYQWQRPVLGWWKCNVDASFYGNTEHTSWGWCIHNLQGQFVAAGCYYVADKLTIIEGEALALLEAISEASSMFESDFKTVVDAVHTNQSGNSEFNSIIFSIKLLLISNSSFGLKLIKRQPNMMTHILGRAADVV
jgi:hypothetical protein